MEGAGNCLNRMLIFVAVFVVILIAIGTISKHREEVRLEEERKEEQRILIDSLERNFRLWKLDLIQENDSLRKEVDTLNAIIEVSFNSAYRFEMILGVKNPDGILSWKEKCLTTPLAIQRLNHVKL